LSDDPSQIKIYISKHIQRRQFSRGRISIALRKPRTATQRSDVGLFIDISY